MNIDSDPAMHGTTPANGRSVLNTTYKDGICNVTMQHTAFPSHILSISVGSIKLVAPNSITAFTPFMFHIPLIFLNDIARAQSQDFFFISLNIVNHS